MEGFSGEVAAGVLSAAEVFEGSDQTRLLEQQGGTKVGRAQEDAGCPSPSESVARQRVEDARQVISATADVVDGEQGTRDVRDTARPFEVR